MMIEILNLIYQRLSTDHRRPSAEMVREAKQRVENLTAEQVGAELQRGNVVLVDLRESDERRQRGGIPGAVSAPRGMPEFGADPTSSYPRSAFDLARRIIPHCASGGRAGQAAFFASLAESHAPMTVRADLVSIEKADRWLEANRRSSANGK
jgi:rhodanese-related sulfurtransferase